MPTITHLFVQKILFGPTLSQPFPSAKDPVVGKNQTHPHAQEAACHPPPTLWHPSMALTTPTSTTPKAQFWILLLRTSLLLNSSSLCPPPQDSFLGPMPSWDPSSFHIPDLILQQPRKGELPGRDALAPFNGETEAWLQAEKPHPAGELPAPLSYCR